MEIFVPIDGYDGQYLVSNKGQVFTMHKKRLMNQTENEKGYLSVEFLKDGKRKRFKVHRLVAQAFIDNPNLYKEINHIDGNKKNNEAENLEWCSRSENLKHAYRLGLRIPKRGKRR